MAEEATAEVTIIGAAQELAAMMDPEEDTQSAGDEGETAQDTDEEVEASAEEAVDDTEDVDDTDEDEDEEEDVAQTYRVKVDGEEYDVKLDELLKGYQRNADYTQKAQGVAKARKDLQAKAQQHNAEVQAVRTEREHYAALLTQLEQQVNADGSEDEKTD